MPIRRVPDVMDEGKRFRKRFIQTQRRSNRARDLRHLHRVCEAAAKMVGVAMCEHLGLAGQTPEGPRVDDARSIALERKPVRMRSFGIPAFDERPGVGNRTIGGQMHQNLTNQGFVDVATGPSRAMRTRTLSSFFCTLPTSPGSIS